MVMECDVGLGEWSKTYSNEEGGGGGERRRSKDVESKVGFRQ